MEGDNDCHVIVSLCQKHSTIAECFGFYSCGSDDGAIKRLDASLLFSSEIPKKLTIVLDADIQP